MSDELVPLNKHFTESEANYGLSSLGYPNAKKQSFDKAIQHGEEEIKRLNKELGKNNFEPNSFETADDIRKRVQLQLEDNIQQLNKNKLEYSKLPKENQTIKYSNEEKFGRGSAEHFDENTLGHSRYLVSNEEPDIFHVLESQSDFYQKNKLKPIDIEKHQKSLNRMEELQNRNKEVLKNMKEKGVDEAGIPVQEYQIKQFEDIVKGQESGNIMKRGDISNFQQKVLLGDKHQERLLQENLDYAAKNGQSKLRYPTSETAAKIQKYIPKIKANSLQWDIENLNSLKADNEFLNISDDAVLPMNDYGYKSLSETPLTKKEYLEKLNERISKYKALPEEELNKAIFTAEHQTILKKYNDYPKMVKKTLGLDVSEVKDVKGNSWYEFDIPKTFKEGKGKIKALSTIPLGVLGSQYFQQQNKTDK